MSHCIDWDNELTKLRQERETTNNLPLDDDDGRAAGHSTISLFPYVQAQLLSYRNRLSCADTPENETKEDRKALIATTRKVLRFALTSLAPFSSDDVDSDAVRSTRQEKALHKGWDKPIIGILSQPKGDAKCRLYAAQVLCNLVTRNSTTASHLLETVQLTPTDQERDDRLRAMISDESLPGARSVQPNWLDFVLRAAETSNREALGAIVAAHCNALTSISTQRSYNQQPPDMSYIQLVASNQLYMSTLLRHVISIEAIKRLTTRQQTETSDKDEPPMDETMEWILHFIHLQCRFGLLPIMYQSIDSSESSGSPNNRVLPEQMVLLYCVRQLVEQNAPDSAKGPFVLVGGIGVDSTTELIIFLTNHWSHLWKGVRIQQKLDVLDDNDARLKAFASSLEFTALLAMLDIVAETLGSDHLGSAKWRVAIYQQSTSFVRNVSEMFGWIVDSLLQRNAHVVKSRDMTIHNYEQQALTSIVRLLGNLCYQCRVQQDLLHATLVPPLFPVTAVPKFLKVSQESNATTASPKKTPPRNVLHVLLTCTTFSYLCFTLREWAVIAIRNALQDHAENQRVVAALEAQQAVQTTALDEMGIRVDLEPNGKVRVTPLDPNPGAK